jgi:hypothetical protein
LIVVLPRGLIQELADFEKMPEGPRLTVDDLIADGFGGQPFFHCYLAETVGAAPKVCL